MDNSTAFWNIIFPTISPFAIIIVFFLLWRIIRRLQQRKWKLITARVLRIEKIDKKDRDGVLEPRQYKLDLVFQWQGVDWHRSWIFPRIYDLPKAGDILQLRYHPQKEDFQLVTSLAEKQKIRHARLVLLLVIGIVIFVPSVLFGLLLFHLPQEQHILSESTVWLFFAAPLLVIFLVVRIYGARRTRRKIESGEFQPIAARVHGFRKDSEGDVYAFCLVRVNGQEKEVSLLYSHGKHYKVGQQVTLYLNPETGEILHIPRMDTAD